MPPIQERPPSEIDESLSVSLMPTNIQVSVGSNVSFDCVIKEFDLNQLIRMYDDLEFEWLKDGAPLQNVNVKKNFNLLELSNLSQEDFGKYSCQVKNSKSKLISNLAYGSIEMREESTTLTTSSTSTTSTTSITSTTSTTNLIKKSTTLEPFSLSSIISSTAKSILKSISTFINPNSDKHAIHVDKDSIVYIEEGSSVEIACDLNYTYKVRLLKNQSIEFISDLFRKSKSQDFDFF